MSAADTLTDTLADTPLRIYFRPTVVICTRGVSPRDIVIAEMSNCGKGRVENINILMLPPKMFVLEHS